MPVEMGASSPSLAGAKNALRTESNVKPTGQARSFGALNISHCAAFAVHAPLPLLGFFRGCI